MIDIRIQAADFDPGKQIDRLAALGRAALASFVGQVSGEGVVEAAVEHYPVLAKGELARMGEEAAERWRLSGVILIHRFGRLSHGDRLLFAGVTGDDPAEANAACAWLTEGLRTRAPFWRKDKLADGSARWR